MTIQKTDKKKEFFIAPKKLKEMLVIIDAIRTGKFIITK